MNKVICKNIATSLPVFILNCVLLVFRKSPYRCGYKINPWLDKCCPKCGSNSFIKENQELFDTVSHIKKHAGHSVTRTMLNMKSGESRNIVLGDRNFTLTK